MSSLWQTCHRLFEELINYHCLYNKNPQQGVRDLLVLLLLLHEDSEKTDTGETERVTMFGQDATEQSKRDLGTVLAAAADMMLLIPC